MDVEDVEELVMTPTKEPRDAIRWRLRRVQSANGVTVPKRKSLQVMNALRNAAEIRKAGR